MNNNPTSKGTKRTRNGNVPIGSVIHPNGSVTRPGENLTNLPPLKVGKMSITPIYNLTGKKFFSFSDEEGGAPFKFSDAEEVYGNAGSKGQVLEHLKGFTFDTNGLLVDINDPSYALGFLGDLIDNREFSIRAMKTMIQIKEKYSDRVILIAGNRDFNKIRYGVELFFNIRK